MMNPHKVVRRNDRKAAVIGSGPNGLAAAIVLAQAGLAVEVFEAEAIPGGAARTMELTLPGFLNDFGSAVHPFAAGSPFFSSLPLEQHGLHWVHSPAPLAHPMDDGSAIVLERDMDAAKAALGRDGDLWVRLLKPFVENWKGFSRDVLRPVPSIPTHPMLLARFGMRALLSAKAIAKKFANGRTRALFAGIAAHSFLSLDEPLSGAFGIILGTAAHAVGWPIPSGGSQSITNALCAYLSSLGGAVRTSFRIESFSQLPGHDLICCDLTPQQLLGVSGEVFSRSYRQKLAAFRYGPAVFKVDYALSNPIPWKASECWRAATVHIGGTFAEIAESEDAMRRGRHAERPFIILAQPSLFDAKRAPAGKHTAWAYCHVPNGSTVDMLQSLEDQIERFAPGFRDTVLARRVLAPWQLQAMDSNLVGGDINGGILDLRQFLFRPTWRHYATSAKHIFICSSSTPPGGGVHGMCGYHGASAALSRLGIRFRGRS